MQSWVARGGCSFTTSRRRRCILARVLPSLSYYAISCFSFSAPTRSKIILTYILLPTLSKPNLQVERTTFFFMTFENKQCPNEAS